MIERFHPTDDLAPKPDEVVSLMQHWEQLEVAQKYRAGKIQDALSRAALQVDAENGFQELAAGYLSELDPSINPLLAEFIKDLEALVGWQISWLPEYEVDNPDAVRVEGWIIGAVGGVSEIRGGEIASLIVTDSGDPQNMRGVGTFIWNMRDIILTPPDVG